MEVITSPVWEEWLADPDVCWGQPNRTAGGKGYLN